MTAAASSSAAPRRGGRIREFAESDIPLVAHLHRTVWMLSTDLRTYDRYFRCVFLDNPSRDATLPSLVYEQDDGRIVGFLGIVPRRMVMNGRRLRAAVSSQFIVDPTSCVPIVATRLAQTFVEGPQDLSIADEANDVSRRIWEGLGGTSLLLRSLYWTRPLRPVQLGLSAVSRRRGLRALAAVARPLGAIADAVAARVPRSPFYQVSSRASVEELRSEAVVNGLAEFSGAGALRVDYDHRTFEWLLERVRERTPGGHVVSGMLRRGATILGWYVCHLDHDGTADAVQIAASQDSVEDVLDRLFSHAWRQGAVAVRGRLDPRFMQVLSDKCCFFHRRGPWMLIKAKNPDLIQSFQSGDAWFSRLDGEWALRL